MTVQLALRGLRGESFADVARRIGSFAGTAVPSDATDAEVLDLLTDSVSELVAAAGFTVISPVRAATTANITLSGAQTIDGVAVVAGNRVLVKNQTAGAENGIWVAAAGAWARATDFDATSEAVQGSYVTVTEGTTNISSAWVLTTADPITVGTTAQTWLLFRDFSAFVTRTTAQTLSNKTFSGDVDFLSGRLVVSDQASAFAPEAILHLKNGSSTTPGTAAIGLDVEQYWQGSAAAPHTNNDAILVQTFDKTVDSSANYSWGISVPTYVNIPAGVTDSGEKVGGYFWTTSVARTGYVHSGTLGSQVGVKGAAGFQGTGSGASAVVTNADGVVGIIFSDSPGATITTARALVGSSIGGAGTIQTNMGVYARALNGTVANYSFYGDGGKLFNLNQIAAKTETTQSSSAFAARTNGNSFEFGHTDTSGYGSNIGATQLSGYPFMAFCAEADASGDTFTTRGKKGWVMWSPLNGELRFSRLATATASAQALSSLAARFRDDGRFEVFETPILPTKTPASATATGIAGEICWDASYIYICTATDTWKRVAIAAW